MKKFLLFIIGILCLFTDAQGQITNEISLQPVSWRYRTEKMADKAYALHLTAIIKPGWHLYAQNQPEGAIAIPTHIVFNSNSLAVFEGTPKEVGQMKVFTEPALGISAWQYEGRVDFVQMVTLKKPAPVKITGSIRFQTCRDEECLPPFIAEFTLLIQE